MNLEVSMKIAIVAPPSSMTKGRKKFQGPVAFLTNKEDGTVFPVSAKDPKAQKALSSPRHREIVEKIHAGTRDPGKKATHGAYLEGLRSSEAPKAHPLPAKVQKDHPKWRNTVWTKGAVAALANADKVEPMTPAALKDMGLSTGRADKAYLVHHGSKKTVVIMKPYAKAPGADTTSWAVGASGQVERATAIPGVAKRRATSVPYKEPTKAPTQDEIQAAIKRADGVISRALEVLGGDASLSPEVKAKVSAMAMDHHSAAGLSFREAAKKAKG